MKTNSKTKAFRPFAGMPKLPTAGLLLAAMFILLARTSQLRAQNTVLTGGIAGRVTDQVGAVVSGASVVLRNLATGLQQSSTTNRSGLYQFLALMPGTYSVTTSEKGFHDVEALVRVQVGNTTLEDLALQVGAG